MLRAPLIPKAARGIQRASTASVPAPTGGWNVHDPLASMPASDAIVMENWFPRANDVILRPGAANHLTNLPDNALTLLPWNGTTDSKLFAACNAGIYDATAAGTAGAVVTSCTDGNWQYVNFQVAGGDYLIAVNGVDELKQYNGTTWADINAGSTPAITGRLTSTLTNVAVSCTRLWFAVQDSSSAWYLPVGQIGGALTEFPLGQIFSRGGYLQAIGTWSIDGGAGPDDYTVFMSSEGEIAVYRGTDPSSAATFAKVGVYYVGEPLGRNCFCKYGGDLLVLCQNGLFPLSKALQSATINRAAALTAKIDTAFTEAATLYGQNSGWQVVAYPQGSFVLVNIPISTGRFEQYVMNSITGAWCKVTGWRANCWEVFQEKVYFGGYQKVAQAWTGVSDFGALIAGRVQQAYSYFGRRGQQKQFKLVRPNIFVDGQLTPSIGLDADYAVTGFETLATTALDYTYVFDTAIWDSALWGNDFDAKRDWYTIASPPCFAASYRMQVASNALTVKWSATDFVFEAGGVL